MSDIRKFSTGATRDSETGKNDYEGFLSPLVIERFGDYMTLHRKQADGKLRDSDNWQKGMGLSVYIKSLFRHFLDLWKIHRGHDVLDKRDGHMITAAEACCAIMFNVMGYLDETLKATKVPPPLPSKPGAWVPIAPANFTASFDAYGDLVGYEAKHIRQRWDRLDESCRGK